MDDMITLPDGGAPLVAAIRDLINKIEDLDISIDYLASAVTGQSAIEIGGEQSILGRVASPAFNNPSPLSESQLKQMIEEELKRKLTSVIKEDWVPDWMSNMAANAYAPTPFFQLGVERWEDDPNIHQLRFKSGAPRAEAPTTVGQIIRDATLGTLEDPGEVTEETALLGPAVMARKIAPVGGLRRQIYPRWFGKHQGQLGYHPSWRASRMGSMAGKILLPYEVASSVHNAHDAIEAAQGLDQWDLENKMGRMKRYTDVEQARRETELGYLLGQRLGLHESQLKQMIEEQLEGLVSEQRPRRGIETTSDTPVLPKIEPRAAETEGPSPPPEVKAGVAPPVTKPDPYAEPKWDPEAMQRHHSEAALYDDLKQWGGKGRFKHHAPSALSAREIEGVKSRWHAGMERMSRPDLTDAQKQQVFRSSMSSAGQIGGESTWDRQRSMGHKGGERYHRINSMPFSNLITGLSGGQRKELHKNLAKSGYWKKLHPSNPIRQDFEKSVYYKKPTKRRRRKTKKPTPDYVATSAKTGKPITRAQAKQMSNPIRESQLKQMIEEEFQALLKESNGLSFEEMMRLEQLKDYIDTFNIGPNSTPESLANHLGQRMKEEPHLSDTIMMHLKAAARGVKGYEKESQIAREAAMLLGIDLGQGLPYESTKGQI